MSLPLLLLGVLTTYGLLFLLIAVWWTCLRRRHGSSHAQARARHRAGRVGEAKVARLLQAMYRGTDACLLSDVTLRTTHGHTTQIDHILVIGAGVFVLEVKHWAGLIQADAQADTWAQWVGGLHRALINPLTQNAGHVRVVREHLARCVSARAGRLAYLVFGLVVCTGSARPVGRWPRGMGDLAWLQQTLEGLPHATLLDAATLTCCVQQLEAARLPPGRATDRRHRRSLAQRHR
jgi:restriction system protein